MLEVYSGAEQGASAHSGNATRGLRVNKRLREAKYGLCRRLDLYGYLDTVTKYNSEFHIHPVEFFKYISVNKAKEVFKHDMLMVQCINNYTKASSKKEALQTLRSYKASKSSINIFTYMLSYISNSIITLTIILDNDIFFCEKKRITLYAIQGMLMKIW